MKQTGFKEGRRWVQVKKSAWDRKPTPAPQDAGEEARVQRVAGTSGQEGQMSSRNIKNPAEAGNHRSATMPNSDFPQVFGGKGTETENLAKK